MLGDDVINDSGVCQNCFIKFNEYDEHQSLADQIQLDLVSLMDNKLFAVEDELPKVKMEENEDIVTNDAIEYEPFDHDAESEELYENEEFEGETIIEAIEEDYHFEIVVDDTKENIKKLIRPSIQRTKIKEENQFIIIEMDDNSKVYQCDICFKTCKDKSKLRSHREIHTNERNVICPTCGKGFKTMNCLRNHKRLHLPMRTYYNCDQCEKKYTQKVSKEKHFVIVEIIIFGYFSIDSIEEAYRDRTHAET